MDFQPPKVRDVMSKEPATINKSATIVDAAKLMAKQNVGYLLVLDGNTPVGMITERDFLKKVVAAGKNPVSLTVDEVMSKSVRTVDSDATILQASELMKEKGIRRLPVMEGQKLVGIVTETDLFRALDALAIRIIPALEKGAKSLGEAKHTLKNGFSYIIEEERPKLCFDMFADQVLHGRHGLGIMRVYPQKIREKFKLEKTPMIWLTNTMAKDSIYPTDLDQLPLLVGNFISKTKNGIVLLEGIEYLLSNNSFDRVLHTLEFIMDKISASNSVLLISLCPACIGPKELKMLERAADFVERQET